MMQAQKKRLGRGLAALIGEDTSEEAVVQDVRNLKHIPVDLIQPSPHNPRKHFAEDDLDDLARSIREKGLLQPLVVRSLSNGNFEIVAGERRWRAAQRAGVHELPALIRELSDGEALEIALIENIQRSDLNPLEEARAFGQLLEQFNYTQQQLADSVGKSRSHIANTMRLLTLPDAVQKQIESGQLTAGHARTLVTSDSPRELADKIIQLGLTVREAESLTRPSKPGTTNHTAAEKPADTIALEKLLTEATGLKIEISDKGSKGGSLTISYKTLEQLDDICTRLQR
jgi:ParB family chromosome partitioning protein